MPSEMTGDKEWRCLANVPDKNVLRGALADLIPLARNAEKGDKDKAVKPFISLGQGDPSGFSCFKAPKSAEEALANCSVKSLFNGYPQPLGLPDARRAVAEHLSNSLPRSSYKPSSSDVYLTTGCTQAIQICLAVLGSTSSNILLPRPGFPLYQTLAAQNNIEVRFYDLIPEKNWEANLDQIAELADDRTVALVVINPNNPCGSVISSKHASEIAQIARSVRIPIISDEVYGHMVFGAGEYIPMATFSAWAPVITLGGLSKRWLIPGWRLGWIVTCDPHGILKCGLFHEGVERLLNIWSGPCSIIQAAVPSILQDTSQDFHKHTLSLLETGANICYERIKKIHALRSYSKPQGSMFIMVKINVCGLKDIKDDTEFAWHLANEEAVVVLPGSVVGLKNWLRILFAAPSCVLKEAWDRIESFCQRHAASL